MKTTLFLAVAMLASPIALRAAPEMSAQDQAFMQQAAIGGLSEVQEAQLAESKAASPEVKQFAQRTLTDHKASNRQLEVIAKQQGIALPKAPDAAHLAQYNQLQKESGKSFDLAYITGQIAAHQQMEQLLQQEISAGSNPTVRQTASATLPVIRQHLQMAQAVQEKVK